MFACMYVCITDFTVIIFHPYNYRVSGHFSSSCFYIEHTTFRRLETESRLRNIVCFNKNRTTDNVRKHDNYNNTSSSQTVFLHFRFKQFPFTGSYCRLDSALCGLDQRFSDELKFPNNGGYVLERCWLR